VLAAALMATPATTRAAPDVDGAVDALIATPFDPLGDAVGALGLLSGSVLGLGGDMIAIVDDNEYTRIVLRGLFSTTIRRGALAISQMSTGGMEGARNENFDAFPESNAGYLDPENFSGRLDSAKMGLGAAGLGVVDIIANPLLFLTRLVGLEDQSNSLVQFQTDARNNWVGNAK
jgi:hypothetical protein